MKTNKIRIQQLQKRMSEFIVPARTPMPPTGWINAVRTALNMTLSQLGKKLGITPQSAGELEAREVAGTVTINALQDAASKLGMQLVYGLVPRDSNLEEMIEKRAQEVAREIVMRTSDTMKLEDQENSKARLERAIQEKAEEITRTLPKYLWD